jgi:hypothetical protein
MFHTYVARICLKCLAVSVLCCSACFHGGKLQVFYLMLHMFHTHVASVCSKCFIRFYKDVAFKRFMLYVFHTVWKVDRRRE